MVNRATAWSRTLLTPCCSRRTLYLWMNMLHHKIFVSIFFIINVILGVMSFEYFLGLAWFPEYNGGFFAVLVKILLIACAGGFILAFLPSLFWPHRIWIWCLGFPFKNLMFGSGIFLSVIFGHGDQIQAVIFWLGIGLAMVSSSFLGGKLAQYITMKIALPWI